MMKKEYMTPRLNVIEVKESLIIATSAGMNNDSTTGDYVPGGGDANSFIQGAYGWDEEE